LNGGTKGEGVSAPGCSSRELFSLRPSNSGFDATGGTLTLPTQPQLTFAHVTDHAQPA